MKIRGERTMKKFAALMIALLLAVGMTAFAGCSSQPEDPGTPPENVIHPGNSGDISSNDNGTDISTPNGNSGTADDGEILENAVSVRIGQRSQKNWSINMYNNAAAVTMMNYLSGSPLLFPTYTYEEEAGFVAQSVRGNYTRDDETTITDIKAGELYLFGGGQLRFYFKDVAGANITATPVGYYSETEGLAEAVKGAYEAELGNVWGVDVYFVITKTID